ncbi:MAG: hypothetical protein DRG78_12030 [Epsilonproteobacteria bacterium]|nr:MAG: hypothetical protein DRG78_12030 [Campylobacterota bacterium]
MKLLCCNKLLFFILFFLYTSLYANLNTKSCIFYYDSKISYPMVGIHDYIIVKASKTNVYTHGFSVYNDKIYASIEIDGKSKEHMLNSVIAKSIKAGFKNFYFDISKDLNINSKTRKEIVSLIKIFHRKYPNSKIILNANIKIIDKVYNYLEAIVIETNDIDIKSNNLIERTKSYGIDIIALEYLPQTDMDDAKKIAQKYTKMGLIPYISNHSLDIYGRSSKNPLKREILVLIDDTVEDRISASAHRHGALILEYQGYVEKLYDINKGLPSMAKMSQYKGVIVWLSETYKSPMKLISWVLELQKIGVKVVFADNFGSSIDYMLLKPLGITVVEANTNENDTKKMLFKDKMIGFDVEPSGDSGTMFLQPDDARKLLIYEDKNKVESVPVAIMPWGGYAVGESFIATVQGDELWVVDPFKFFVEALDLESFPVPDPSTHNGKRLLFTHIDGDGIMNVVEWDTKLFSGDTIYEYILKKYQIPHSVSVIGSEIRPDGLYPELSKQLMEISRKMYALDNVEAATHTFTHPYYWGEIKNDDLALEFRLKVINYDFSIDREIRQSIEEINTELNPKIKANAVFWSGDCAPRENAMEHIYKNNILNINGGDTVISNVQPWVTTVASLGLERGEYYQIYTGAQNENVFTNDWLGPFWGFKRVVQTFKLTDSPRRFKPIDVYYHLYSGSKRASLNALKYIFNWAIAQDVMPIYTSEYIPKVMDYFTVSIAKEDNSWLYAGMNDLKTVRIEKKGAGVDLKDSKGVLGLKHFETHTYLHLDNSNKHIVSTKNTKRYKNQVYLVDANAKLVNSTVGIKNNRYTFDGYVALKLKFNIPKKCKLTSIPKASKIIKSKNNKISLTYKHSKKAVVNVSCK